MFRKHQGSELNQHIRVIQRLVPGRQCFIHNPIHPSRSISSLLGPSSTEWFGTFASCSQFFWLMLILDYTLARVYDQSQVQPVYYPFLLCFFLFLRNISNCPPILPPFILPQLLIQTRTYPKHICRPWNQKDSTTIHLDFQDTLDGVKCRIQLLMYVTERVQIQAF